PMDHALPRPRRPVQSGRGATGDPPESPHPAKGQGRFVIDGRRTLRILPVLFPKGAHPGAADCIQCARGAKGVGDDRRASAGPPEGAMKQKKEVPGEEEFGFEPEDESEDIGDEDEEDEDLIEDDDLDEDEEDLDEEDLEGDFDEEYEGDEDDIDDFEEAEGAER